MVEDNAFNQNSAFKHAIFLFICLALLVLDKHTDYLTASKHYAQAPFQSLTSIPHNTNAVLDQISALLQQKQTLKQQVEKLQIVNTLLDNKIQYTLLLERENQTLKALLGVARDTPGQQLKVGQVIREQLNAFEKKFIINLGSNDGIQLNQTVMDHQGLIGKITYSAPNSSTVLLLTSQNQAVPVVNVRNGERGILFGNHSDLDLKHLNPDADVQIGDILNTSGLGDVFPAGYPVAQITQVQKKDRFFSEVKASPLSDIKTSQYVLVLTND